MGNPMSMENDELDWEILGKFGSNRKTHIHRWILTIFPTNCGCIPFYHPKLGKKKHSSGTNFAQVKRHSPGTPRSLPSWSSAQNRGRPGGEGLTREWPIWKVLKMEDLDSRQQIVSSENHWFWGPLFQKTAIEKLYAQTTDACESSLQIDPCSNVVQSPSSHLGLSEKEFGSSELVGFGRNGSPEWTLAS